MWLVIGVLAFSLVLLSISQLINSSRIRRLETDSRKLYDLEEAVMVLMRRMEDSQVVKSNAKSRTMWDYPAKPTAKDKPNDSNQLSS